MPARQCRQWGARCETGFVAEHGGVRALQQLTVALGLGLKHCTAKPQPQLLGVPTRRQ